MCVQISVPPRTNHPARWRVRPIVLSLARSTMSSSTTLFSGAPPATSTASSRARSGRIARAGADQVRNDHHLKTAKALGLTVPPSLLRPRAA